MEIYLQDLALFFSASLAIHLALLGLWQLARARPALLPAAPRKGERRPR